MNRSSFVHLHNHTHGSVLDGLQTPSELVAAAVADGQPAVAVTDHGALTETLEVAKAAKAAGIRPLIGCENYVALGDEPDARCHQHTIHVESDDTEAGDGGSKRSKKKSYEHLTIIAANTDGWRSLCRHADIANSTGKFYTGDDGKAKKHLHGRIDFETIERYHDGLIFLTGCLGGPVAGRLQRGDDAGADRWLARLVGIVGKENVLVEVMDHGNPEQRKIIPGLVALARKYGLRMVATNDSHYSHDSEYGAHDAWLAAQTGRSLADPHRFGRWFPHHSVRSAAAMRGMFDEQPGTEQACNNTLWVAERVEDTIIPFAAPTVPPFPTPPGFKSSLDYFKHLIREGAAERYGTPLPPVVQERINFECKILKEKGFIDYFLVEHELVSWERSQGGRIGPGRGSAAGCAVAYCLGITNVDPIRWGLLFERFMHPERTSMPDIDTDFEPHRREAIFEHLADFWGKDRFARIGTVGTVKARAAIVRAAKVLDAPSGYDRKLANAVPPNIFGRSVTIAEALADGMAQGADLRRIRDEEPFAAEVLELAEKFENRIASEGIHACGVVIGDRPLADFLPLRYTDDGTAISQYIDKGVEALGLVKYDVLGLINLTVISAAVRKLIEDGTVGADIDRLPWEGPEAEKVFSMIAAGDTIGVFQLGNSGMRDLCRRLIPRAPEDLFALLALYRPGPMASGLHNAYADRRNGREEVSYDALTSDPAEIAVLEPILGPTYGVLVFQEQILKLAQQVAGWSPGDSDDLRSAVGKKLRDKMADLKARFVADLQTPRPGFAGLTAGTADRLWGWIEANADYSFNKCLTGDTVVTTGGQREVRLDFLHELIHGDQPSPDDLCAACRAKPLKRHNRRLCSTCSSYRSMIVDPNPKRGLRILAVDSDGRVRPRRVKAIWSSGDQPVWKVTLSDGRSITATANHRHLTAVGYRRVDELAVGDHLVVNAGYEPSGYVPEANRTTVGERSGVGRPYQRGTSNYGFIDGGFAKLSAWTSATDVEDRACFACGGGDADGGRWERAHLDGDRTNNEPSNLAWMHVGCHKAHDYAHNGRTRRWERGAAVGTAQIVSIEDAGVQPTFDVEMDSAEHNFVANGVVTHNSHTVGYGHVAWQTAWLKCHHPVEYAAALLTYEEDPATRLELFADMADHSIPVLLPDVNASGVAPSPAEGSVRLGLGDIAGLGETAAEIVAERDANGPYRSAAEIVTRCSSSVNTRTVENLIRSGACDAFGSRLGQIQVLSAATKSAVPIPAFAGEWSPMQRLHHERLALGLYISGHPVLTVKDQLRGHVSTVAARFSRTVKASDLANLSGGAPVAVWGVVSGYVEKLSKRGNRFAKFVLDAPSGQVEVIAFSGPLEAMARRGIRLASTQIVKVCGDLEFPDVYRTDDDVSEASEAKPQIVLRDAEVFVPVEPARLRLVAAVAEPTPTVAAFRLAAPETPAPVPAQPPTHEPATEPVDAAETEPTAETEADTEAETPIPAAEDAAQAEVVAPAEEVTPVEEVAPIEAAEPAAKTATEPAATSPDSQERAGRNSVISLHGSLAQMGRKLQMAG